MEDEEDDIAGAPFLEAVKKELDAAGLLKGLPLMVFLYLLSKAI